jgi:hypothetical protein
VLPLHPTVHSSGPGPTHCRQFGSQGRQSPVVLSRKNPSVLHEHVPKFKNGLASVYKSTLLEFGLQVRQ